MAPFALPPGHEDPPLRRMKIAGYEIDTSRVTRDGLLDLARTIAGGRPPADLLDALSRFSPDLAEDVVRGRCLAPAVRALLETAGLLELRPGIEEDVANILCAGDPAAPTETFATEHFQVHYQRTGSCAVPELDEREAIFTPGSKGPPVGLIEPGRAPNYVKRLAFWLETARTVYLTAFDFADPAPGGPIHVCVTCADDGAASPGHLFIARSLGNDMLCCVAVHELFHVFQFPYNARGDWGLALFEGGAVFAEDTIADGANRYLYLASKPDGVLRRPDQSLEHASYDASLLWHYIAEQWHRGTRTQETAPAFAGIYLRAAGGTCSSNDLEQEIRLLFPGRGFSCFVEDTCETLLGNYAVACYLKDVVAVRDRRFYLRDNDKFVFFANLMREPPTHPSPVFISDVGSVRPDGELVVFAASVQQFGHRYYELSVDPGVAAVELAFTASVTLGPALVQIVRLDDTGHLVDIYRSRARVYRKRVHNSPRSRIGRLVLVVTSTGLFGDFQISAQAASPSADAMITRRNRRLATEYEADPEEIPWTRVSPDLWIEEDSGERRDFVMAGEDNRLTIRVHNRGLGAAVGLCVDFEIQQAGNDWAPLRDSVERTQVLRNVELPGGTVGEWNVLACPSADATGNVAFRATLFVPGDPNTDNKVVVSEFECRTRG